MGKGANPVIDLTAPTPASSWLLLSPIDPACELCQSPDLAPLAAKCRSTFLTPSVPALMQRMLYSE